MVTRSVLCISLQYHCSDHAVIMRKHVHIRPLTIFEPDHHVKY